MATITNEGGPYGASGDASSGSFGTAITTGNHGRTNLGKHYSAPIKDDAKLVTVIQYFYPWQIRLWAKVEVRRYYLNKAEL